MTAQYAASQNGHVEVLNILLHNGAQVDVQDEVSLTFHTHSTDRVVKLRAMYVQCTYHKKLHFQDKWTPLMIASDYGHVDVVNVLLQHGASVHLQNEVKLFLLTYDVSVHKPSYV